MSGAFPPIPGGMKTRPAAFAVHLLTGSGAALALMALVAATQADWRLMFGWLGIALIVDGIDGPLARRVDIKRNAANWDGVLLDLVVDYLTYVFIPAYALIYSDLLPSPWGLIAALTVALTGVVYFADVRMKAEDNSFVGFPAVFQMPLLVFLVFQPPSTTQSRQTVRFTRRQRTVRTGWMNLSRVNCPTPSRTMIATVSQTGGSKVRKTKSGICQTAGKPTKQLSSAFIRTSAKYIAPVSATKSAARSPRCHGRSPV